MHVFQPSFTRVWVLLPSPYPNQGIWRCFFRRKKYEETSFFGIKFTGRHVFLKNVLRDDKYFWIFFYGATSFFGKKVRDDKFFWNCFYGATLFLEKKYTGRQVFLRAKFPLTRARIPINFGHPLSSDLNCWSGWKVWASLMMTKVSKHWARPGKVLSISCWAKPVVCQ